MIIMDKLSNPSEINTLIFDIDGTITRWKNIEKFLQKSLTMLGVPYTKEALNGLFLAMKYREVHGLVTKETSEDIYSSLLENYIHSLKEHQVKGDDLKNTMFELEASETFLSPETKEEIDLLSQKYNLIAYTNWFRNQAIKKLARYDLIKYFQAIHSSQDSFLKTSKFSFLWLLKQHQLDAKKTVHIGDSKNDIVPSHCAGLYSIYLDYDISFSKDITKEKMKLINIADASITEFKDIRRILTK